MCYHIKSKWVNEDSADGGNNNVASMQILKLKSRGLSFLMNGQFYIAVVEAGSIERHTAMEG